MIAGWRRLRMYDPQHDARNILNDAYKARAQSVPLNRL